MVDLAAGKFPVIREVSSRGPQRHEEGVGTFDDRSHDNGRAKARRHLAIHLGPDAPTGTG